jgi:SAM-dependent methyltransferase
MSADSVRECDLCGGLEYEGICQRDRRGKPWNTVACRRCGLVGHEIIPTEEELEDFYARQYRKDYHGETTPSDRRVVRAWHKGARVVKQMMPTMRPGDRVFEIGAGLGLNVKQFELAGYPACGIEPSISFQKYAAEQLHASVEMGQLFDYQAKTPFNLILLIHVIEHFRSPRRALQTIHSLLAPGGRLYLECPSLGVYHADRAEMFHSAHIWTFTPQTLTCLARRCGFEVHTVWSSGLGINHKILFVKTPTQPDYPLPGLEDTHTILRTYCAPWHRFQGWYLYGRLRRIGIYAREFLYGRREVQAILQKCQQPGPMLRKSA